MLGGLRQRPVLGLLTDALDSTYQSTVLSGAADAARDHGADLFCFAGGGLHSPLPGSAQRNVLYDLVGPHNVDALLVMTGTLGNAVGAEALLGFLERYRPLPMCSIAVELPDMFSVLVDNERGVRDSMEHLVQDCGRHRIAFVRGPLANAEAQRRYLAYREALVELGLPFDPALVVPGDFSRASGAAAVATLWDDRGHTPDAILAVDDLMALGVLDALLARGVAIPEEVAVVGFNDIEEARFATVPLSTVRQPLYEQGKRAALALLASLRGDPPSGRLVLGTELIKRRSSGLMHDSARGPRPQTPRAPASFEDAFARRRTDAITRMGQALVTPARHMGRAWVERLVDAFADEISGRNNGDFGQTVRDVVDLALQANTDGASWQEAISILRRETLECVGTEAEARMRAENLCEQARIAIAELVERAQVHQRLQVEAWARGLGQTIAALISTFDVVSLVDAVAEQFPRLAISSCYLSLYKGSPERAELLLAFDARRAYLRQPRRPQFPSRELMPEAMRADEPRVFVVEDLFFQQDQLGFVLFEYGPREGLIYEALRDQISAALKGALLVQEVIDKDRERERLMQDLEKRARQLERAYKALQEGQRRLLVSETMASLGQMSARTRPLGELFVDILSQLTGLLGSEHALLALAETGERTPPPDIPQIPGDQDMPPLTLRAGSGRYAEPADRQALPPQILTTMQRSFAAGQVEVLSAGVALPLVAGERAVGVIFIEHRDASEYELELLKTFSDQATAAIQNARLYQMAAQDPLTGVHARRFFDRWLPREIEAAFGTRRPLGVLMVDMDDMKRINDTGGHLAGDQALVTVGRVLRQATRDHDVIARYGGDEFALILPNTDMQGTEIVAQRILSLARNQTLEGFGGPLRCSVGAGTLSRPPSSSIRPGPLPGRVLKRLAQQLVGQADEGLYAAKKHGGARLGAVVEVPWPSELLVAEAESPPPASA